MPRDYESCSFRAVSFDIATADDEDLSTLLRRRGHELTLKLSSPLVKI